MARGKSRTQIFNDMVELVRSLEARKVALAQQIEDAKKESLTTVVEDLERRHEYVNQNLKKAKATIRRMKGASHSMVAKPGDNTDKTIPGGIQGKGTFGKPIIINPNTGPVNDFEVE